MPVVAAITNLSGMGFVTVQNSGPHWGVSFTQKLPPDLDRPSDKRAGSPYRVRVQIANADSLPRALETADKFAERQLGFNGVKMCVSEPWCRSNRSLSRNAFWRNKPASKKQVDMLLKLKGIGAEHHPDVQQISIMGKMIPLKDLTAGQVCFEESPHSLRISACIC